VSFRNPLLLDVELLRSPADYAGVEIGGAAQVTRRTLAERRGRAGINKGLDVGGERGATEEITESYSEELRPVRALNDVIDHLLGPTGRPSISLLTLPPASPPEL